MQTIKKNPDIQRLEEMIGAAYMYRARNLTVTGYAVHDDQVQIRTKGQPVLTSMAKLGDTLDEFLPVQQEPEAGLKSTALAVYENDSSQMNKLEEVLMDNIEKLKDDPKYLDQAKEINQHAKTMIGINRQKIEMIREIRNHKDG